MNAAVLHDLAFAKVTFQLRAIEAILHGGEPSRLTVAPIAAKPVDTDERYFELHRKCADGSATPDELTELQAMCEAKSAAYQDDSE